MSNYCGIIKEKCWIAVIENTVIEKRSSYIQSWLHVLKEDSKFIVSVAAQVQKVADYIKPDR